MKLSHPVFKIYLIELMEKTISDNDLLAGITNSK